MNLQLSKFETYLLDEEQRLDNEDVNDSVQQDSEFSLNVEFPLGFFTSL